MVVWMTRKEDILQKEHNYHQGQLKMKIRTDRKSLVSADFGKRWVRLASLFRDILIGFFVPSSLR